MNEIYFNYILQSLDNLRKTARHVDLQLSYHDRHIQCHRVVLAAFCKTFRDGGFLETENTIFVEDSPEYFITKLYNWCEVTYADFINHLMIKAHDFGVEFLLCYENKEKRNMGGDALLIEMERIRIKIFSEQLQNFWKNHAFTDVILKVKDEEFKCHKPILAAVSSYFDAMFMSGMREKDEGQIILHGIQTNIMEDVLHFIYTGENVVNTENADLLLSAAVYFQIECIKNLCEQFLMKHIDEENCVDLIRLADVCQCEMLKNKVQTFFLSKFDRIAHKCPHQLQQISTEELISLVQSDNLIVTNENVLLKSIFLWFSKQDEKSDEKLHSILKYIRFQQTDVRTASEIFSQNPFLEKYPMCKSLISQICQKDAVFSQTKCRNDRVLLVLQGCSFRKSLNVVCYSFLRHAWYKLSKISYNPGCGYSACLHGGKLFISGGSGNPTRFVCYDCILNETSVLPYLKTPRSEHSTCGLSENIYLIGGNLMSSASFSTIENYNIRTKSWSTLGKLIKPVSNAACVCVDNKILIFGGTECFGQFTRSVQCFELSKRSCHQVAEFPNKIMSGIMQLCSDDWNYFTVTADGKVIRINKKNLTDIQVMGSIHKQTLIGYTVVCFDNDILLIGDNKSENKENKIMQFKISSTKQSNCSIKIPFTPESNEYCAVITFINRYFLRETNEYNMNL